MKKIITIIIAIIAIRLFAKAQQEEQQQIQEANKTAEEIQQKAADEQAKKQADAMMQMQVNKTVTNWYLSYNGYLPVYADDWRGFTKIPKEYWYMVKQGMTDLGYTYKQVWEKIEHWSNSICKTGFYKSEFDEIRDELKKRTNW